MNEAKAQKNVPIEDNDVRKLWVAAVENMVENEQLKERIEFLERKLAMDAFAGWTIH